MNKQTFIDLRNILLGCFFIGFIFLAVGTLLYMPCDCVLANIYLNEIGVKADTYFNFWTGFVGAIKMVLIFLFLTPALSLQLCATLHEKKEKNV